MSRNLPDKVRGEVFQGVELPRGNRVWERGSERNSVVEVPNSQRWALMASKPGRPRRWTWTLVSGIVRSHRRFSSGW